MAAFDLVQQWFQPLFLGKPSPNPGLDRLLLRSLLQRNKTVYDDLLFEQADAIAAYLGDFYPVDDETPAGQSGVSAHALREELGLPPLEGK